MKDNRKTKKNSEKSWTVDRERIEENDFILSDNAYKPASFIKQNHRDPKEIMVDINFLNDKLGSSLIKINKNL